MRGNDMKNRIPACAVRLVLVLAVCLILASCTGSSPAFRPAGGLPEEEALVPRLAFAWQGQRYRTGMDARNALGRLGENLFAEVVSTNEDGSVNRVYTFGVGQKDFEVATGPESLGGPEVLKEIRLLSPDVSTEEGLHVGDPEEKIPEIYPEAVREEEIWILTRGMDILEMQVRKEKITKIIYRRETDEPNS